MLQPLVGHRGWMRLDKITLDSDSREEFLRFTAVDDAGANIDQETAQRLFDVSGSVVADATPDDATMARLTEDAQRLAQATLARAAESGNARFRQVQNQVNQWADDKITAAEQELDVLRREIRAARREAELAETVAAQQEAQAKIARLEAERRRARRNIDDVEEKVETERQQLLRQLQARSQQRHSIETLFTLRFEAV